MKHITAIILVLILCISPAFALDDVECLQIALNHRSTPVEMFWWGYEVGYGDALNERTKKIQEIRRTRELAEQGKLYPIF